ncbi:MAG: sigma-70 family RNA polymerase sigma factor [Phycisphaerae bacterium]|nr:sigma-70 family RNA polymerase sigma factor [Phycisphaerae bacterium]
MDPAGRETIAGMLVRASRGDSSAWRELVAEYAPRVFALLRSQCHDEELAEEITQSTFCTLVSKLAAYTEQGKFEAWIFRIAVNRLRDEMRRRQRHAVSAEESMLISFEQGSEPEAARPDPAEIAALERAMSQLSPADRLIVDLRHVGGMSFKQLAEYLGEPLGTLLARHHRALHKLRSILEDDSQEAQDR